MHVVYIPAMYVATDLFIHFEKEMDVIEQAHDICIYILHNQLIKWTDKHMLHMYVSYFSVNSYELFNKNTSHVCK